MKTSKGPACYGCDEKRGIVWQSDSPLLLYLQITPDGLVGLVCVGIRDFAVCQTVDVVDKFFAGGYIVRHTEP